ncbi:MAG: cytochrome P450 [Bacteroidota bacterium]
MEASAELIKLKLYKGKNILGIATDFIANTPDFIHRKEEELGDFYQVKVPVRELFVTFRPSVIKRVLQTNARNYKKSVAFQHLKSFVGEGLVTSEGDLWKKQRKISQPVFYKANLQNLITGMGEVAEAYYQDLASRVREEDSVNMAMEMMQVTADVVMRTLFSSAKGFDKQQMYESVGFGQEVIIKRIYMPFQKQMDVLTGKDRKFEQTKKAFDDMIFSLIRERKANPGNQVDLLSMMLNARYADTGEPMEEQQLRDELVTFYLAGHETSANALSWTLYLMAKQPDIIEKVRAEEARVLNGKLPTMDDLKKLTYTRQVLEEGLRLYPPAYVVSREAIGEDIMEGVKIPAGSTIYLSFYALQRSPQYWEEPNSFRPDRFSPENKIPRHAYMPFGAGARMCIGNHFAMMEMQILLSMLIRRFDIGLLSDKPISMQPLVTLKPKNGIMMRIKPR